MNVAANDAVNGICGLQVLNNIGKQFDEIPFSCGKSCLNVLKKPGRIREMYYQAFSSAGYMVKTAKSAEDAIKILENERYWMRQRVLLQKLNGGKNDDFKQTFIDRIIKNWIA